VPQSNPKFERRSKHCPQVQAQLRLPAALWPQALPPRALPEAALWLLAVPVALAAVQFVQAFVALPGAALPVLAVPVEPAD
jgi:hypothetical protein